MASLVAAIYFMVSGGPYGLEELIQKAGYGRAILFLALTPLIWSLPVALLVGELAAALSLAFVVGGMLCGLGMTNALVLAYSRVPLARAEDGRSDDRRVGQEGR